MLLLSGVLLKRRFSVSRERCRDIAQPAHDYNYGNEDDQYIFYRLPKTLFTCRSYKCLSDGAKILYGLMLDRMGLSMKNGWLDDQGRVCIYFTLEDVQEYMNCKHEKAVMLLAELDTAKGIGLIERVRQGQGKPTVIYVKKFVHSTEGLTFDNQKSALPKNQTQDFRKSEGNKNEISGIGWNHTVLNDTEYPSYPIYPAAQEQETKPVAFDGMDRIAAYRNLIRENIEFEVVWGRACGRGFGADFGNHLLPA